MKTPEQLFDEIVAGEIACPGIHGNTPLHSTYEGLLLCLESDVRFWTSSDWPYEWRHMKVSEVHRIVKNFIEKYGLMFSETNAEFNKIVLHRQFKLFEMLKASIKNENAGTTV